MAIMQLKMKRISELLPMGEAKTDQHAILQNPGLQASHEDLQKLKPTPVGVNRHSAGRIPQK